MKTRIHKTGFLWALVATVSLSMAGAPDLAFAKKEKKKNNMGNNTVTLIEMGDLHGTLVPHAAVLRNSDGDEYNATQAGGLAKLKKVVDGIRAENPENLLLSCGDLTHGSAETLFTVGDVMMKAINAFDIDVFTPGNWDFGYGPAVFRNRFTSFGPKPGVPPNIQVMAGYIDCNGIDDTCTEEKGIIKAEFPAVAINLYNAPPIPAGLQNERVLDAYRIFDRGGVKIAVIGITASIVPQQADVFNIGLRFTQGVEELPEILAQVKAEGADLIVVQSELGMSQNIEIARNFKDIDVMYSAHTHEITVGALLADEDGVTATTPGGPLSGAEKSRLAQGAAIVVETNRDMYVGQLDVQVAGGKVIDFTWQAHQVDDDVIPDAEMLALVKELEEDFVLGDDGIVTPHVFLPGAFCNPGCGASGERGHYLVDDLDTPVGQTDTLLLRHHVLEDTLNNWLADAIRIETNEVVANSGVDPWAGVDISMSNGFRFGNAVLPNSDITLRDLYTWFPVGPAVNVGEFAGQTLKASLEEILAAVFNRNPFLQRGGWYLGLGNMTQEIDLDHRPFSSSSGRIVGTKVGTAPLDTSKRYVFASCYAHGDAIDRVCRTGGGSEHRFFELFDAMDYNSAISIVNPVNPPSSFPPGSPVKRVAPYKFVHPVHLLRRHLDRIGTVEGSVYGVQRVTTVDSRKQNTSGGYDEVPAPVPDPDPTFVQPPQGAGPLFFSGNIGD
ncbi:MAG: 5'-nucleotidase C-terminal domain-containing protein [Deltaproteobacteria bacterium]|nr:5'-nucleotidase C-terminal domain-containing protein [Deltaproteobacteria bacterium]